MRDLLGREIDYLRLSVTDRCNLRCTYCMPGSGVELVRHDDLLRFEEIERLCAILIGSCGIAKIRVTGGEPLLRRNLADLIRRISALSPRELVLTTNGLLLPDTAEDLAGAGLQRVNISLDSLRDEVLAAVCRAPVSARDIEKAVESAHRAGLEPVKINTVLIPGVNEGEVVDFIIWGADVGAEVRFIELMPGSGTGPGALERVLRAASVLGRTEELPGAAGDLQRTFGVEGTGYRFGVIAPLSDPLFCSRCRRIRLASTGDLMPCLGSQTGIPLREVLRSGASDEEIAGMVRGAVESKPAGHSGCDGLKMWRTGG